MSVNSGKDAFEELNTNRLGFGIYNFHSHLVWRNNAPMKTSVHKATNNMSDF
jgi:hypothetical protein